MAYFRKLGGLIPRLADLCRREDRWLILINADPDALASALALKRILSRRVADAVIARINEVTRPDNLAMIRSLRIPVVPYVPGMREHFQHFAMVDSQPHHAPQFQGIEYSVVIDHHPISAEHPVQAAYVEIHPSAGAVSTLMTEYLYNLGIRPGKALATALMYGIRTDTSLFEHGNDVDLRAYQYLGNYGDSGLLKRIARSEYLLDWLGYFSQAFRELLVCRDGYFTCVSAVESPDILVTIADFFTRVHGLKWIAVCGVYNENVIIIFRSTDSKDVGHMASELFTDVGSGGGHRQMARTEFPLSAVAEKNVKTFVFRRLKDHAGKRK